MRVWRQWIIGLIVLVTVSLATAQDAGAAAAVAAVEAVANDTSTKPPLTGNPQIDYIHDPNLPYELKTYDLSKYPFYPRLPEDLLSPSFNFTCEDRLDGFYASVPHRCQVYHNCLFAQRYDFLCPNFTVFDQKNFVCHYVSEVDCPNSADHYDRNEELYVTTTTSTTTVAPPQIIYVNRPRPLRGSQGAIRPRPRPFGGNKRRTGNRRTTTTAAPEYYDDYYYNDYYDEYYDDYYNGGATTTTTTTTQRPRRPLRKRVGGRRGGGGGGGGGGGASGGGEGRSRPSERFNNSFNDQKRPRVSAPGPLEDEPSVDGPRASRLQQSSPAKQQAVEDFPVDEPRQGSSSGPPRSRPIGGRKPRPGGRPPKKTTTTTTTTTTEAVPEENYDYYYDYADEPSTEPSTTAAPAPPSRPSASRTRPGGSQRRQQGRPTPTTTEAPTTDAPRGRVSRPRVNSRGNPINSRNSPVDGGLLLEEPQEPAPTQDTAGSQNQRPQRLRPQFPKNRSQGQLNSERQETVIDEAPPLEDTAADNSRDQGPAGNTEGRSRTPIRRLSGQSRQSSNQQSGRGRGGQQNRPATPDYYDY